MSTTFRSLVLGLLVGCLVVACAGATTTPTAAPSASAFVIGPDRPPEGIEGAWQAVMVAGQPVVAGHEPTATFRGTEVTGTTGCNSYGGSYTYADGKVTFGPLRMTMMACIGPIGEVESRFTQAMGGATTATTDAEGRLILDGTGGAIVFIGLLT